MATARGKVLTLSFTQDKETPNAIRFAEDGVKDGERGKVGSIYLLKTETSKLGNPTTISVSIKAG